MNIVVGKTAMKIVYVLLLSSVLPTFLLAQTEEAAPSPKTAADTANTKQVSPTPKTAADTAAVKKVAPFPKTGADSAATQQRIVVHSEAGLGTKWNSVRDSIFYTKYNKYGDLKDDDPVYNRRKPWWYIGLKITATNIFTNGLDRYIFSAPSAKIGYHSWKHNIKTGWEWDTDRFGMNFFFHPYSGGSYFNSARASGYNFYQSFPFAVGGSLMWEYFGETTLPSINDVINTPVSGMFIGEVLYRLSSNVLDDRATGAGRFWRELAAVAIDPARAFGRFTSGQMSRHTPREVYQKEPLNITLSSGIRKLNV
jgi:hypothetical protein